MKSFLCLNLFFNCCIEMYVCKTYIDSVLTNVCTRYIGSSGLQQFLTICDGFSHFAADFSVLAILQRF